MFKSSIQEVRGFQVLRILLRIFVHISAHAVHISLNSVGIKQHNISWILPIANAGRRAVLSISRVFRMASINFFSVSFRGI